MPQQWTDRSGEIAVGGTAQVLSAADATRRELTVQNISASDLWLNETGGTAQANGTGSWKLAPGASVRITSDLAISIIGATTGQKFTATEI